MFELISAVKEGNLAVTKTLIESGGADINARDINNLTILHLASRNGYKDIVDYLVIDKNFDYENISPPIGPMTLSGVHVREIVGTDIRAAADVVLMRGMAQRYAGDGTVKRYVDVPKMLELIITSIGYIERSQNEIGFIAQNPHKPEINVKEFFQKEVLTWISACARSAMLNNAKITEQYPNIPFKALSAIGKYTDLVHAMRGRQYDLKIVDTADQGIISAALPKIFDELFIIRDYLNGLHSSTHGNHISSIPALVNYYSDISHLERIKIYTETIVNPLFNLNARIEKEALLRSLEALGEAIGTHLSETGRAVFQGIDIDSLLDIRNKLDHINGDMRNHKASSKESRAERLEELLEGNNQVALKLLEEIVKYDIHSIHQQTLLILDQYKATIVRPNYPKEHNQYMHSLIMEEDQMEAEEARCLAESWSNIQHLEKDLTRPLSSSSKIPSYLKDFGGFLSLPRFLKQLPDSILGKLKAINTSQEQAWKGEAKKILFNNSKFKLNAAQEEQLTILRDMLKIDDNMYYLIQTINQITSARDLFYNIPKGGTPYRFGSAVASLKMDTCKKSIEFNLINFNEHVHDLCKNPAVQELYTQAYHTDISGIFNELIEKARNYFSHIGNNAFHGTQQIDHGTIIREIVPLAIQIHTHLVDIHQDLQGKALTLLTISPHWDNINSCNPILSDNLIRNDENLPELLHLARIRYGDQDGMKKLIQVGIDNNKYINFQNLRDGFGSDVAVKLIGSTETKANINLALTGGALMKFMEVKPALTYLLTQYFPVLPVIDQYFNSTINHLGIINFLSEYENLVSTSLHFLGGTVFTYNLFGNTGSMANIKKFAIPLTSSAFYGSKQYLYNLKSDILFALNDQKTSSYLDEGIKFTFYVATDIILSVLISAPFIVIAGFPLTVFYPATQGAAMGMLNYYNNFNQKQHEENSVDYVAAFATTSASVLFFSYKITHLPTISEKIIATACAVQTLANIHFLSKSVYNIATDTVSQIYDFIYREDEDRDINLELAGEL